MALVSCSKRTVSSGIAVSMVANALSRGASPPFAWSAGARIASVASVTATPPAATPSIQVRRARGRSSPTFRTENTLQKPLRERHAAGTPAASGGVFRGRGDASHAGTPGRPGRRRRHLGHPCRLPPAAAPAGARVRGVTACDPAGRDGDRRDPAAQVELTLQWRPPRVKKGVSGWVPGPTARAQRSLLEVLSVHT